MSKKKRARKEYLQEREYTGEYLDSLKEDALAFYKNANPFKVSCELTRRGVSTAHQSGIFELLDSYFFKKWESNHPNKFKAEQILAHAWRREAEGKGRTPDAEDLVFFITGALHFSLKWAESRLAETRTELERRDDDSVVAAN